MASPAAHAVTTLDAAPSSERAAALSSVISTAAGRGQAGTSKSASSAPKPSFTGTGAARR